MHQVVGNRPAQSVFHVALHRDKYSDMLCTQFESVLQYTTCKCCTTTQDPIVGKFQAPLTLHHSFKDQGPSTVKSLPRMQYTEPGSLRQQYDEPFDGRQQFVYRY